jgi:hypothetical protein
MVNEFWYYFNKNEEDLTDYIRKILFYPSNYNTLVEFRNYLRNYQVFLAKDYNEIDKKTNETISELLKVLTKALNDRHDEIPSTASNHPTVYSPQ